MLSVKEVESKLKELHPEKSHEQVSRDAQAFMKFARNFDCLDCSYEEANMKILASMQDVSDELESIIDEDDQIAVLRSRYANLY